MKIWNILFYLHSINAFILPLLQSNIGTDYKLININRNLAYKYLKQQQLECIKADLPFDILYEFCEAKEYIKIDPNNHFISIIKSNNTNRLCDYLIIYRRSNKAPVIFSIEAIIKIPYSTSDIHITDVFNILQKASKDTGCFIQTQDLNTWHKGKIVKQLLLERSYEKLADIHLHNI